jgi:hypothetical protein
VLTRLVEPIRAFGALAGALYLADRAARRLGLPLAFSHHMLVVQPVAPTPRLPPGRGRSIDVRPVAAGTPGLDALDAPPAVAAFRFGQGAACLGAYKGDATVGLIWLAFDRYTEDAFRLRFELEPQGACAWDLGLFIAPDQRGGLAFARLWDGADQVMRARGVRWTLSRVAGINLGSNAAHARLQARPIATLVVVRLGPVQVFLASIAPYVRVSWRPGSYAVLRLRAPA